MVLESEDQKGVTTPRLGMTGEMGTWHYCFQSIPKVPVWDSYKLSFCIANKWYPRDLAN